METRLITSSGKIRDRALENPVEQPREFRRRFGPEPRPVHPEALGVEARCFAALPTGLWNEMTSLMGETLRQAAGAFDDAFKYGAEGRLAKLLQSFIPGVVYALGRGFMEALLRQERGFYGSRIDCHECDGSLCFQGYIKRKVKTKLGPIEFARAYYTGACGHSATPLDTLLGIDGEHGVLPDLQECAALLSATMSYPKAVELLQRLLPVGTFSLRLQENVTQTVAGEFMALQCEEAETVEPGWRTGEELEDRTVVVAVDGGMCRVRDHAEDYKEFKLAVMGELEPKAAGIDDGEPLAVVVNKSYVATFEGPNEVYEKAVTEYVRKGHDRAAHLHFISDGATWIARRVDELAHPGQTLTTVLDWYHASEHLKKCANELFPPASAENTAWYESAKSALYNGDLTSFFKKLREAVPDPPSEGASSKSIAEGVLNYFEKRRPMLRYKEYREMGLPIGSGIVEGGIRFVGKDRLDCTGMRWLVAGAERILALRCIHASVRWDKFSQIRSQKRTQRFSALKSSWLRAA